MKTKTYFTTYGNYVRFLSFSFHLKKKRILEDFIIYKKIKDGKNFKIKKVQQELIQIILHLYDVLSLLNENYFFLSDQYLCWLDFFVRTI